MFHLPSISSLFVLPYPPLPNTCCHFCFTRGGWCGLTSLPLPIPFPFSHAFPEEWAGKLNFTFSTLLVKLGSRARLGNYILDVIIEGLDSELNDTLRGPILRQVPMKANMHDTVLYQCHWPQFFWQPDCGMTLDIALVSLEEPFSSFPIILNTHSILQKSFSA
jgi:hypothetical protein